MDSGADRLESIQDPAPGVDRGRKRPTVKVFGAAIRMGSVYKRHIPPFIGKGKLGPPYARSSAPKSRQGAPPASAAASPEQSFPNGIYFRWNATQAGPAPVPLPCIIRSSKYALFTAERQYSASQKAAHLGKRLGAQRVAGGSYAGPHAVDGLFR
jgi:hypothetical protein